MKYLFMLFTLPLFAHHSFATNQGIPILDTEEKLGRLLTYETTSGRIGFVPVAFSHVFSCYESDSFCSFLLYNKMNTEEESTYSALQNGIRYPMLYQANPAPDFLTVGQDRISGPIADKLKALGVAFGTANNYVLLRSPYFTSYFRMEAKDVKGLQDQYEKAGIGAYEAEYRLRGVVQEYSLKVERTNLLHALQILPSKGMTFSELKAFLVENIDIKSKGYAEEDAQALVTQAIMQRFMKTRSKGQLILSPAKRESFTQNETNAWWSISEVLAPAVKNCKVTLPLKKHAELEQKCELTYED